MLAYIKNLLLCVATITAYKLLHAMLLDQQQKISYSSKKSVVFLAGGTSTRWFEIFVHGLRERKYEELRQASFWCNMEPRQLNVAGPHSKPFITSVEFIEKIKVEKS